MHRLLALFEARLLALFVVVRRLVRLAVMRRLVPFLRAWLVAHRLARFVANLGSLSLAVCPVSVNSAETHQAPRKP